MLTPGKIKMNNHKAGLVTKTQPATILRLALLQLVGSIAFSLTLYYCFDAREAISALLGGLVAVFASLFSAFRLYTAGDRLQAGEMLVRFYISVILKIVFSVAMIAIFIIVMKVSVLPFIIAYLLAAVIINILVLLIPQAEAYREEN
jgi:F0F1-type ATP synthase assembly protein I